jgi:hypothetical protein
VICWLTTNRALQAAPWRQSSVPQVGVEPTAFEILSLDGLPVAYRGVVPCTRRGSRTHRHPGLSRAARPVGVAGPAVLTVRGEGLEPPSPGSEPGGLPLADPRNALFSLGPSRGGWTRTSGLLFPKQAGLPLPHTSNRAAAPHTNPAGDCDSLGRHFSPRGVSVRMARFELAFSWFPTTRPLQAGPHPALRRRAVSPEGLEPSPDRLRAGNAAANTLDSACVVKPSANPEGLEPSPSGLEPGMLPLTPWICLCTVGPERVELSPCGLKVRCATITPRSRGGVVTFVAMRKWHGPHLGWLPAGREALESSSPALQASATPSQLPTQTKRPGISCDTWPYKPLTVKKLGVTSAEGGREGQSPRHQADAWPVGAKPETCYPLPSSLSLRSGAACVSLITPSAASYTF